MLAHEQNTDTKCLRNYETALDNYDIDLLTKELLRQKSSDEGEGRHQLTFT